MDIQNYKFQNLLNKTADSDNGGSDRKTVSQIDNQMLPLKIDQVKTIVLFYCQMNNNIGKRTVRHMKKLIVQGVQDHTMCVFGPSL